MKRSRFTETRIVSILKEADAGKKVKDICRGLVLNAHLVRIAFLSHRFRVLDANLLTAVLRDEELDLLAEPA